MWQRKGRSPEEAPRPRPCCSPLLGKRITAVLRDPKKNNTTSTKTARNDVILSSELLLILDVLVNVRKVNPTWHHIQSAHFTGIEVNALGKHSPSVIIETDHEFRREIIIWQSLLLKPFPVFLPSVFSCIFNLTAAAYWRWQAFLKPAGLPPQIRSFITKRLFCKLVACVGKGRETTKK